MTDKTTNALAEKYQQKTDKEHILANPDTYIGSVENVDSELWLYNVDGNNITQREVAYIPGLYKLFDEGIVNCRDHVVRMKQAVERKEPNALPVTYIDIGIQDDGTITMTNDGNGIDVAMHPEYNIWIPELIFGHLRTSTNYNKEEKKIVGGKNGFGFKLVLIWSSEGSVETIDHTRGLKYSQTFSSNLDVIGKPKITKCKNKPYTKITFKPDFARFGITGLTPDMKNILIKRIYDVAAITDKNIKVKFNGQQVAIKTFPQYVDMFIGGKSDAQRICEDAPNGRWEYAVALSPTHEFQQVSYVNGIHTSKGGKHVDYILTQITRKLSAYIEKKKKVSVNSNSIKEQIILFLRCDIENPAFDSQTKDYMNTPSSKFGSSCSVSEKFIEKIAKMGVMDAACAITEVKENKAAKKTDGTKSKNVRGIHKLIDANWAGTNKSSQCTIIFCEGDSAKAGIVSGLSSTDRNIFGVYPMKGKIMNVRGETTKKITDNKEIADIKKILGLEAGKEYRTIEQVHSSLRYGRVLFMTDQDLDGSHIKGLGVNLFETIWPSLTLIPGFIGFMNTPILKARKGNQELLFYNTGEYESWLETQNNEPKGWNIKYYKGLGTSTGKEFREYFEKKKIVGFEYNTETSKNSIDMIFNKKRSDDRKDWLSAYDRDSYLDTSKDNVTYDEFINKELIHFSKYDCDRSIPNLMDGLKISLRKILYAAFKKNLNSEIKVAQFSGYVSEHSGYHHGEASLNAAIVGMAQTFVGSNNINLLVPSGQFGTRLQGGKDSASERYIFTYLNDITRKLYPSLDDPILKYLNDDGQMVEPLYYTPIIPMILVNGAKGIGTGFSTDILCYNPLDIINLLEDMLGPKAYDLTSKKLVPYYDGFKGEIHEIGTSKYLIKGKYEMVEQDKIHVYELPVGYWTDDFKSHLEGLLETTDSNGKKLQPVIKDYNDMSKDTNVDFEIHFHKGKLAPLIQQITKYEYNENCYHVDGVDKLLKLVTTSSTSNMHLFDHEDKLKKYDSVMDIVTDYYGKRMEMYGVRKDYMISELKKDARTLSNKARYIKELLADEIDLRHKSKAAIDDMLSHRNYDKSDKEQDYKYLTKMPMDSVSNENAERLMKEYEDKKKELQNVQSSTLQGMWLNELKELREAYIIYRDARARASMDEQPSKKTNKKKNLVINKK